MLQIPSPSSRRLFAAALTASWLLAGMPVMAQEVPPPIPEEADEAATPTPGTTPAPASAPAPDAAPARKELALDLPGRRLDYAATAEMMPIVNGQGETTARIFVASYTARDADRAARPVTFLFNGGPGAASAFLHLGVVGPKVLVTNADGTLTPPPARLQDNPETWLAFTDLVFVDPVGTGFSRATGKEEDAEKRFFGVQGDVSSMSEIVRLWLARNGRWASPKYIAGESYGGFRAVMMARHLQRDAGIALNGLILVSPALEFSLLRGGDFDLLGWAMTLPSMAASAQALGRGDGTSPEEAERFALDDYLVGLASMRAPDSEEAKAFHARVARLTGLPVEVVERFRAKLPIQLFAKELPQEPGRVVSLYDGTIRTPDPSPERQSVGSDPFLDALIAPYSAVFNDYVRTELGFETEVPYRLLNRRVSGEWSWDLGRQQGYVGATDDLQEALAVNPDMHVLVTHGITDLVTPYLASRWLIDQLRLPAEVKANLAVKTYPGGHMMYMRPEQRRLMNEDVAGFYERSSGERR
ncbi:septum formation initiator [Skermanella sp. TT6]|uniref:Septum formation initiator n=1 Tax=Skermanella cutis TaxID=2775420 RepID=A0ABX7BBZ6_9PROT|nr:septum formation initiator [Skermanella sp. TT6]QQP91919.1 septum formation initiator [Skermanella sp. TT6]